MYEIEVKSGKGHMYVVFGNDNDIHITPKTNYKKYVQNASLVYIVNMTVDEAIAYVRNYL